MVVVLLVGGSVCGVVVLLLRTFLDGCWVAVGEWVGDELGHL